MRVYGGLAVPELRVAVVLWGTDIKTEECEIRTPKTSYTQKLIAFGMLKHNAPFTI